ncbi:MAG: hypothetical protein ABIP61_13245, partial [Burkholderiaceae bacterium]
PADDAAALRLAEQPPADDAAALQLADQASPEARKVNPWRIYGEVAASRGWLRSPASTGDGVRASLDLRYDATLAHGLRAVLSDRLDLVHDNSQPDQHNVNALREAYVSWKFRPDTAVDLGRVNVRHGAAWGYNPTDYFKGGALRSIASPNPASLRENRLGTVMVQAQKVWSGSSFTAALAPKLASAPSDAAESLDLGATNPHTRWLLAASHNVGAGFSPQLLLHGGDDTPPQVGLNVSGLLNSATVGFFELSAGKGRSLRAQALNLTELEAWQQRAALGLTLTTSFNLSLTAEADYSSAAPNRAEWDTLRTSAPLAALRFLGAAQSLQELPTRRGAFFYATWRDAFVRRLDLSGFVRQDLVTHSRVQWLETRYHWDQADLALQWQAYSGKADTVYGSVPRKRMVELSLRLYF